MRRREAALALALALFACGGEPSSARSPASNLTIPVLDASAPPPATFDASLPKGAIWTAALDGEALAEILASRDLSAIVMRTSSAADVASLCDFAPTRSLLIAQAGLTDAQRAVLATTNTRPLDTPADVDGILQSILAHPEMDIYRVVLPATDPARAKALLVNVAKLLDFTADGDDGYVSKDNARLEFASDASTLVIDIAIGKDGKASLAELRARGHGASITRSTSEAVHIAYRPGEVAELAAYDGFEKIALALGLPSIEPGMRFEFGRQGVKEVRATEATVGSPSNPAFDHVDIVGRRDHGQLGFDVRVTPGPASTMPPARAWKPSPSFLPDGAEAFISFSPSFVSAWKLAGDPPDATMKHSPVAEAAAKGFLGVLAAVPVAIPVVAHLFAGGSDFPDSAFVRFDRVGSLITSGGGGVQIGLLAKDVKAGDAACIFAPKTPCATPLKVGASAIMLNHKLTRLLPIRGTTSLVVATSEDRAVLDGLKLHATTAGPLEAKLPRDLFRTVYIPWLMPGQHLAVDVHLEGNVTNAQLTPTP